MFNCAHMFGHRVQQTVHAVHAWGSLIRTHNIQRIVEIGTGCGYFSLNLLAEMLEREGQFQTWDIVKRWENGPVAGALNLEAHFRRGDVFKRADEIGKFVGRTGPTAVFCDGGNKRKELATFYPYLKEGDVIAVHDWGWAVSFEDRRGMSLQKLEESKMDPLTAFFLRVTRSKESGDA